MALLPYRGWSGNAYLQSFEPRFEWGEQGHFKSLGQVEIQI